MTLRPHCLQCGSASVIRDEDVRNGRISIYCAMCGNRQYKDTDYIGFEMREGGNMGIRATCKNCGREGMSILREGLCGTCAKASKKNPAPADREVALAEVRAKIERGELKGPRVLGPRKTKDAKNKKDRVRDIARGIGKRFDAGATYLKPEEKLGPAGDLLQYSNAELMRQKTINMAAALKTPISLHLRFSGEDIQMFREFSDYCHRQRRDPAAQILCMIEGIVVHQKSISAGL